MRTEWLPTSAAALVVGSAALFLSALTIPRPTGDGTVMQSVVDSPDTWLVPVVVLLIAAGGLIVGMPCLLSLFPDKGSIPGYLGTLGLALGSLALCGVAHQMVLLRSMAMSTGIDDTVVAQVAGDQWQSALLQGGFLVFYVGELLVAVGLLRARTVPRWVPWLLVAQVVTALGMRAVDIDALRPLPPALLMVAFLGIGFYANLNGVSRFGRARTGAVRRT